MLRCILISTDQEVSERLQNQILELGQVAIVRKMDRYPGEVEMLRVLRAQAPQVVFLGIERMSEAFSLARLIEANAPGVQVVAVHRTCDPQSLLEVMRAGIREFISLPFERQAVVDVILRLQEVLEKTPPQVESSDLVLSFLPSKAGVGASTIALNTAVALSQLPDMRVLLADFDLTAGMIRFMLKLTNTYSVLDAVEHAADMDENLWPQLVSTISQMDTLHAGKMKPEARIDTNLIRELLEFARRNYRAVCVDLSGNLERHSIEIMHESKRVFLVCTPELPSLHLAREKYSLLKSMDLGDRVSVLLNRAQRRSLISVTQIEELLGVPVHMSFPNDYQGVHRALTAGKHVEPSSELGRQFAQLARSLAERKQPATADSKRRFVEYFSLVPARYSLFQEGKKAV